MLRPLNPRDLHSRFRQVKRDVLAKEHQYSIGAYSKHQNAERQLEYLYHDLMNLNTKITQIRKYRQKLHLQKRLSKI